jgi:(E)-4-hydroxy-3-methylbut-2-enyl-diphosphate synthase
MRNATPNSRDGASARNPTRTVRAGSLRIGSGHPISVQSMCATHTQDVEETVRQTADLERAGAGLVRIAVDTKKDAEALAEIRKRTTANLVVDLQENYRVVTDVAPHVDKVRYNPGHLYHAEKQKPVADKVKFIAETAAENGCALRIGVNCGSVDPEYQRKHAGDEIQAMVQCALDHAEMLERVGFTNFVVSLKDSAPAKVIEANSRFAAARPDVPLHLGVTEAGLPPDGVIKTRVAFEQLIARGIGDTVRVSLTLPNPRKAEEVTAGLQILEDIRSGRFRSVPDLGKGLNIIACPSCSRVENEAFIDLAEEVRELTRYAQEHDVTIAVMGCRVNGPGETDNADLGLWCGPRTVNLKRKSLAIGAYPYGEVLGRLREELDRIIRERAVVSEPAG